MAKKKAAKKAAKKKTVAKKSTVKKPVDKKKVTVKAPANPIALFDEWYSKVAQKKVDKIESQWVKENEPNNPDEDEGGDHWHVNEMMFNGDAHEMTAGNAEPVFLKGYNGEPWTMNQGDSLYCELDEIIEMAYPAGQEAKKKHG